MATDKFVIGDEGTEYASAPQHGGTEVMRNDWGQPKGGSATVVMSTLKKSAVLAWLIQVEGDAAHTGFAFPLNENVTSIGRSAENDIMITDDTVSNQHSKVRIEEGKFIIYDLVTTNGTLVNGEAVHNREIKENDEIKIGDTLFVFKLVKRDKKK